MESTEFGCAPTGGIPIHFMGLQFFKEDKLMTLIFLIHAEAVCKATISLP